MALLGRKRTYADRPLSPALQRINAMLHLEQKALLRLPQVLELVGVSRSHWWQGVREGKFPAAVKLSPKCTVWTASSISELLDRVASGKAV